MNRSSTLSWEEANQVCLMAALAEVRTALETFLSRPEAPLIPEEKATAAQTRPAEVSASIQAPRAIEALPATFGLSPFERKILLMCAGVELDARFASLYRAASNDLRHSDRKSTRLNSS